MNVSDDELAQAVEQVLAYYYEQEREHRQASGEGGPHILDSLETLKRWLEGRDGGGEGGGGGQPGDFGGGGVGSRHNILAYSESKTMKARQLIEADPLKPIPFKGPAPSDPAGAPSQAATDQKQEIKKSVGGTAFLKKLRDPSKPKSKYNLPRSEHETEHLLGETVAERLIHDDAYSSDFDSRPGGPEDPMRSASVNVPYGDFDYSGPERGTQPAMAGGGGGDNHVQQAMQLLGTLQDTMSPDELDAIIDQSQSMSGEEFHALVKELVQQKSQGQPAPTSRFDLNFGEDAVKMVSTLLEDDIPGGKAPDDHSWGNLDKKQLAVGTKVEMEHTNEHGKAEEIAADHLTEDPDYYTKLEKAGLADELE